MNRQWTVEESNTWYNSKPWYVGCNFIPSYAGNTVEFWLKEKFDISKIDFEMKIMADWGMNFARVYLQYVVYRENPEEFLCRVDNFLNIANRNGIKIMFVLFDDCASFKPEFLENWDTEGMGNVMYSEEKMKYFLQPNLKEIGEPLPNVHNSMWVSCPGSDIADDPESYPYLENYVTDIVTRYAQDERVLMWDIYNEPYNSGRGEKSDRLIRDGFKWVRACDPSQPSTCCVGFVHHGADKLGIELSDIISMHCYRALESTKERYESLKKNARPVFVSEWMARKFDNSIKSHLPFFKEKNIWNTCWGFMDGRTQTKYPWGFESSKQELTLWFHDLVHPDATPYDPQERELVQKLSSKK